MPTDLVEFHDEAGAEYDAAFDWCRQRSLDAAFKLDAEVDRALAHIIEAPQRWAIGPHSTRRFLLRQFPFTLIYRERSAGKIEVVAVAHTSRNLDIGNKDCRPQHTYTGHPCYNYLSAECDFQLHS